MTDQNEIDNENLDEGVTTAESEGDRVGESSARSGQTPSPSAEVDLEFQNELRKVILGIQNDLKFSSDEKAKKIQDLMTSNWRKKEEESKNNNKSPSNHNGEPTDEDLEPTYVSERSQTLGCQHYPRGAKLQAECCKGWFTCRFCHDEECDHKIDRHATQNMMCMDCKTVQPVSQSCNNCGRKLARYYCEKCKFWDDSPDRDIYHCDSCGICRKGMGLDIDFFHCDVCGSCLSIGLKDSHKCIEKNLERDCVICGEFLFTSTNGATIMNCGHSMHKDCYDEYIVNAYQCPTCWKSIGNMELYFRRIDAIVAEQKMPPEYDHCLALILCNDCEKRSTVRYHFLYHKCPLCQGYNTKLLETRSETPEEEELSESEEGSNSSTGSNVVNNNSSNNGLQVRQSRVMEITAMMQGEEGPVDDGNATEHRTRNPLN